MNEYIGKYAQVNDLNMHYYDIGEGYPVILIHGGGEGSLDQWGKIIPLLSNDFRIIAPDSRGHGKTDNPKKEFSYNLMAQDIVEFINVLNIDKPIICGWSDGGQIGLELGIHYSDKVKALIMGGTFSEIFEDYIEGLKAIGVEGPGKINFDKMKETIPDFVHAIIKTTSEAHGEDYWKPFLENLTKMWFNPEGFPKNLVENIKLPTLIVGGDKDQLVPIEESIKLHKKILNSNLAVAPDSDHFIANNQPELFKNLIFDFIKRNSK
ncbi:MAG: alpha/beta fold hydrolase [Candidatus Hodarchaeales archaeon]|jgi:pimeloyl-ACP methyl ester carboxylesterase